MKLAARIGAALCLLFAAFATPGCAADQARPYRDEAISADVRILPRAPVEGEAFGGLSGIEWDPVGDRLIAVSDRGAVFALPFDIAAPIERVGRLQAPKEIIDAEAIRRAPDGGWLVVFEVGDLLAGYAPGVDSLSGPPKWTRDLAKLGRIPFNGGIESLTPLDGERWLILTETGAGDRRKGWILHGANATAFEYEAPDGFQPTDAATLPNGDVLVLERRFNGIVPPFFSAKLARIDAKSLKGDEAFIQAAERVDLSGWLPSENWEGLAIVRRAGVFDLWFVSDDNFIGIQRSLLARIPVHALFPGMAED